MYAKSDRLQEYAAWEYICIYKYYKFQNKDFLILKKYISYARINLKYQIDRGDSFGYRGANSYGWKE